MSGFVGIGFGAIQAGLFLREAARACVFDEIAFAARRADLVQSVNARGSFFLNTACDHDIAVEEIQNVRAFYLGDDDRNALVGALSRASEIAVAVSSVADYQASGRNSLSKLLADAIALKVAGHGPKALIYAAENHHDAAELLENAILRALDDSTDRDVAKAHFQTVDTVIGKMSRVVDDPEEILEAKLHEIVPGLGRAFLVEAFNRIQIASVDPARTSGRGIAIFEEKADLRPFEDAKLHGHNATHALFAYFGQIAGDRWIADTAQRKDVADLARSAFVSESGGALCKLHGGIDPLFEPRGYQAYVDDLLERMSNPFLRDTCERIGRDVERKLGWDDRLAGTMRKCIRAGITPHRYAMATLAAIQIWLGKTSALEVVVSLWRQQGASATELEQILGVLSDNHSRFRAFSGAFEPR